jgi:hypothetical protein
LPIDVFSAETLGQKNKLAIGNQKSAMALLA